MYLMHPVRQTYHCAQYDSSWSFVVVLARPPMNILPGTKAVPPIPGGGPLLEGRIPLLYPEGEKGCGIWAALPLGPPLVPAPGRMLCQHVHYQQEADHACMLSRGAYRLNTHMSSS